MTETTKNVIKYSSVNVKGDMHVGDIYNFITKDDESAFVIIVVVMTESDIAPLLDKQMSSFKSTYNNIFYLDDDDDCEDDLNVFFESCFKDVIPIQYYHTTSEGWKPFYLRNKNAVNESIHELLTNIFNKRTTTVRCIYIESDLPVKNLLQTKEDKEIFLSILSKSVIILDPISLSSSIYKEFVEGLKEVPIGGLISPICSYLPNEVIHFSKLQLKRISFKWHLESKKPKSEIHLSIPEKNLFEKYILETCEKLGYEININAFKSGGKTISNFTKQLTP